MMAYHAITGPEFNTESATNSLLEARVIRTVLRPVGARLELTAEREKARAPHQGS